MWEPYRFFCLVVSIVFSFTAIQHVQAVDFTPGDEDTFQANLNTAESNGFDDNITLPAGTFETDANGVGGATFEYVGTDGKSLTIEGAGIGQTILDGNNTRQVLRLVNTGPGGHIVVRGVTIQNANSPVTGQAAGAGLGADTDDGDITIEMSEFLRNVSGVVVGGFSAETDNGDLNCNHNQIFFNETGGSRGGASCLNTNGKVFMNHNWVVGNLAQGSIGGFLARSPSGTVTCEDNRLIDNLGSEVGGAACLGDAEEVRALRNVVQGNLAEEGEVGGLQVNSGSAKVTCEDNEVTNNQAQTDIGGIKCFSGGGGNVQFLGNTVVNNVAFNATAADLLNGPSEGGAGALAYGQAGGDVFCHNNKIYLNSSGDDNTVGNVGGIECTTEDGTVEFINNIVAHNSTFNLPGGAYLRSNQEVFVIHNTISGNTALTDEVGGILIVDTGTNTTHVYNNNVIGNIADADYGDIALFVDNHSAFNFFSNIFLECGAFDSGFSFIPCEDGVNAANNKNEDPLFVDPRPLGLNFNLLPGSPAIAMGDPNAPKLPTTDHEGKPLNNPPDIGALAFVGAGAVDGGGANGVDDGGAGTNGGGQEGEGQTDMDTGNGCSLQKGTQPTGQLGLFLFLVLAFIVLRTLRVCKQSR